MAEVKAVTHPQQIISTDLGRLNLYVLENLNGAFLAGLEDENFLITRSILCEYKEELCIDAINAFGGIPQEPDKLRAEAKKIAIHVLELQQAFLLKNGALPLHVTDNYKSITSRAQAAFEDLRAVNSVSEAFKFTEAKIRDLSRPSSNIPRVRSADLSPDLYEVVSHEVALENMKASGWRDDPLYAARYASAASSYLGKEGAIFGAVIRALVKTSRGEITVEVTGSNLAEGSRHTNCAERIAYGHLKNLIAEEYPGGEMQIQGVHIFHGTQRDDFRFICCCQHCRELFQNCVAQGEMQRSTPFSFQSGPNGEVLITSFGAIRPLFEVGLDEVMKRSKYIPQSCEAFTSIEALNGYEHALIAPAVERCVKSSCGQAISTMLLDGSVLSCILDSSRFGFELLRNKAKLAGNNVHQAFCLAIVGDYREKILPALPASQLDLLFTAAQVSGFDCWVYVVGVTNREVVIGSRVRISELFVLGKGMADSKAGDDHNHRLRYDRIWNGEFLDGPIEENTDELFIPSRSPH